MRSPTNRCERDLQLADVATFLGVLRARSLHGAARALGVTSSQVSKAVARLELQLGVKLLVRSTRGVAVSDAGRALAPRFEDLLARARDLRTANQRTKAQLTVAGSAFMNALFLPLIVDALPGHRVLSLDMPPGIAGAYASEPFFDLALTAGNESWPDSWVKVCVGMLRQALFASPQLARELGPPPVALERLRQTPFIVPIYSYRGHIISGDDGCPLPLSERRVGHETQTLALALSLAQRTQHLVFAPELAVSAFVRPGALVEIPVDEWNVLEPLQVACHAERISAPVQRRIVATLRAAVTAAPHPPRAAEAAVQ